MPRTSHSRYEPTVDHRKLVEDMAAIGMTTEQIRTLIKNPKTNKPITLDTLYRHYRYEIQTGGLRANGRVAAKLFKTATEGQGQPAVSAGIFWMKCRARWNQYAGASDGQSAADLAAADPNDLSRKLRELAAAMRGTTMPKPPVPSAAPAPG